MDKRVQKIAKYLLSRIFKDIDTSDIDEFKIFLDTLDILRSPEYLDVLCDVDDVIIEELKIRLTYSDELSDEISGFSKELIAVLIKATVQTVKDFNALK